MVGLLLFHEQITVCMVAVDAFVAFTVPLIDGHLGLMFWLMLLSLLPEMLEPLLKCAEHCVIHLLKFLHEFESGGNWCNFFVVCITVNHSRQKGYSLKCILFHKGGKPYPVIGI